MILTTEEIQQWLEKTKFRVQEVPVELEASARDVVFSSAARVYDTTTWVDEATTPSLIRKIMSMLVAAWTYEAALSESTTDTNQYAALLEQRAMLLLSGVNEGTIDLSEVEGTVGASTGPAFWPTALTGSVQQYDAAGIPIGDAYSEDIKFTMGMRF
jgi:hypothetical protein